MKYLVRSKEGELSFGSFGEVEQAWLMGLVEPNDEVLEEGHTQWRKASSFPLLVQARRHGDQVWGGTQMVWMIVTIVLGSIAMFFLIRARGWMDWAIGGVATLVLSMLLIQLSVRAQRRTQPHRTTSR